MTEEQQSEPVASTSWMTMGNEKNSKIPNGSKKKRGILDIDALWKKKFKEQSEKAQNNEKGSSEKSETVPSTSEIKLTENRRKNGRREEKQSMERSKAPPQPVSFQSATSQNDRVVRKRAGRIEMETLHSATTSADMTRTTSTTPTGEMSRNNGEPPNNAGQYEFAPLEYPSSVTPTQYTLYAGPDSSNYASTYYQLQYSANMATSPQDNYMVVHTGNGTNLGNNGNGQGGGGGAPHSPGSMDDGEGGGMGHTTRASPATIQWLVDNYETADGTSLPRCTLYDHYKKHCVEHRLDPVNAASFGKLIRSVFLGLRTRRLGTRGNSKYHYYGIRIKPESPLARLNNNHCITYACPGPNDIYSDTINQVAEVKYMNQPPPSQQPPAKRIKTESSSSSSCRDSTSPGMEISMQSRKVASPTPLAAPQAIMIPARTTEQETERARTSIKQEETSSQIVAAPPTIGATEVVHTTSNSTVEISQHPAASPAPPVAQEPYSTFFTVEDRASLGDVEIPQLPFQNNAGLENSLRNLGLSIDHLEKFIDHYYQMCKQILGSVKNLEFESVEEVWTRFWLGSKYTIVREEIVSLCTIDEIQDYMIELDLTLYQCIVDTLIPNVLMTQLSATLTQSCRTFAKNIDIYLKKALMNVGLSENLMKKKMRALRYMQQGLKRYTSLNHLAQAARAVLQKQEQVQQMFTDYVKVDMNQVHEQAGYICGCDTLMVQHVNAAFKQNLQRMASMTEWAEWLESIVDQVLAKYHDRPAHVIANVGKQFLLNWSFYTSMIIRDLTLRSATSFGSFHLIRLLADDYMYYLIESKISKAGNVHLITVIRDEKETPLFNMRHEYIVPSNDENELDGQDFDDELELEFMSGSDEHSNNLPLEENGLLSSM